MSSFFFFFFKQKTAYELRISDWSADVCSSDLRYAVLVLPGQAITDEQQYAFSQHFGPMETATGDIARTEDRRLSMDINDIRSEERRGGEACVSTIRSRGWANH